jgi:mono/diheme cytochrome c family protein
MRTRAPTRVAFALLATMSLTLAACTQAPSSPAERMLGNPADVKRGKSIFVGTCGAYCHSMTKDFRDAPYLFDCEWLHGGADEQIFATISNGVPGTRMIGFKDKLPQGDDDIWRLVAYLKSERKC